MAPAHNGTSAIGHRLHERGQHRPEWDSPSGRFSDRGRSARVAHLVWRFAARRGCSRIGSAGPWPGVAGLESWRFSRGSFFEIREVSQTQTQTRPPGRGLLQQGPAVFRSQRLYPTPWVGSRSLRRPARSGCPENYRQMSEDDELRRERQLLTQRADGRAGATSIPPERTRSAEGDRRGDIRTRAWAAAPRIRSRPLR